MSWNWRFRRRVRIAPGATLNLGKRAASLSLGAGGAHVTVGPRGRRVTIGAPAAGYRASACAGTRIGTERLGTYGDTPGSWVQAGN